MYKETYKIITHPMAFVFWTLVIGLIVYSVFNYQIEHQADNPNIDAYSYIADYLNVILSSAVALAGALVAITIAHRTERVSDAQGRIENQRYLDEQLKNASSLFSSLSFRLVELITVLRATETCISDGNDGKEKDKKRRHEVSICVSKITDGLESIAANQFAWKIWDEKSTRLTEAGELISSYLEKHTGDNPRRNNNSIGEISFNLIDLIGFGMKMKNYLLSGQNVYKTGYSKVINDTLSGELKLFMKTSCQLQMAAFNEVDSTGKKFRNVYVNCGGAIIIDLFNMIPNGEDILLSLKSFEGRVEDDDLRNFLSIFDGGTYIPSNLKAIMKEISEKKDLLISYTDWKGRTELPTSGNSSYNW